MTDKEKLDLLRSQYSNNRSPLVPTIVSPNKPYNKKNNSQYKAPTMMEWAESKNSYSYLPSTFKEQLLFLTCHDIFNGLQDPENDALVCIKMGDIAAKILKDAYLESKGLPRRHLITPAQQDDAKKIIGITRELMNAASRVENTL
jgi:hypothetical protein